MTLTAWIVIWNRNNL